MDYKEDLKHKFNAEMFHIYEKAKTECKYNATRFLKMLNEHGGIQTAKTLIHSKNITLGLSKLWELKRLDLTVEALIVENDWGDIFSKEEIEIAKEQLERFNYKFPKRE